ncbi:MAG: hypothetical protein NC918_00295 [Candidatus Omnitrophica bacterium]|nr:hypothetical protein [Candidatus Omnitrophota bacterium]
MNKYDFYTTDEGIEFYTKLFNKGNQIETIVSNITILYFYNESIAKIIELPNSTLLGGEEQIQITSFNHSELPPYKYTAIFFIEYNNGTKKNSSLYFTISNPPTTQQSLIPIGTSSSGGAAFIGKSPSFLDKKIDLGAIGKVFSVVGGSSFSELYKNERGYLLVSIKNQVQEPKIIFIEYPTQDIFSFSGPKEIVIPPFEVSKLLIPFDFVKKDEKTGYYLVELKFRGENQTQVQTSLINLKEESTEPIKFKRNIIWNSEENTTSIYLELKNNLDKKLIIWNFMTQFQWKFLTKLGLIFFL